MKKIDFWNEPIRPLELARTIASFCGKLLTGCERVLRDIWLGEKLVASPEPASTAAADTIVHVPEAEPESVPALPEGSISYYYRHRAQLKIAAEQSAKPETSEAVAVAPASEPATADPDLGDGQRTAPARVGRKRPVPSIERQIEALGPSEVADRIPGRSVFKYRLIWLDSIARPAIRWVGEPSWCYFRMYTSKHLAARAAARFCQECAWPESDVTIIALSFSDCLEKARTHNEAFPARPIIGIQIVGKSKPRWYPL